jgi:AcrR family transcriptional regulator
MSVPRQDNSSHGRVNQKSRTRAAVVAAAKELIAQGLTPTVAQAAEAALVGRTTAYRYFPTQESLLMEITMNVDVDDIERLVATPVDAAEAGDRAVHVLSLFNEHVYAAETEYRTALRLYLDRWLEGTEDRDRVIREGRRRRWLEQSLAPLEPTVDATTFDRIVAALCVLCGAEAAVVLRDVCQLESAAALDVTTWAAQTLLEATFRGSGQPAT